YAELGLKTHKDSVGGKMCATLLAQIEQPSLAVQAMSVDAVGKPSIAVTYKNLTEAHFRLVPASFEDLLQARNNYGLQPGQEFMRAYLGKKPVATWSETLPKTVDYQTHRAFASLPDVKPGIYILLSSHESSFSDSGHVLGQPVVVSDFVIRRQPLSGGEIEVGVFRGDRGTPITNAGVHHYQYSYRGKMQPVRHHKTDAAGHVKITAAKTGGQL